MGLLRAVAVFATLAPGVALAQYPLPQDQGPANPEAVTNFCYYAGTLYSVGARLKRPRSDGGLLGSEAGV
jgi:hypothetical protein